MESPSKLKIVVGRVLTLKGSTKLFVHILFVKTSAVMFSDYVSLYFACTTIRRNEELKITQ